MTEKRRLLVVEDEEKMRNGLYELLTDEGYSVETAEDGLNGTWREAYPSHRVKSTCPCSNSAE